MNLVPLQICHTLSTLSFLLLLCEQRHGAMMSKVLSISKYLFLLEYRVHDNYQHNTN